MTGKSGESPSPAHAAQASAAGVFTWLGLVLVLGPQFARAGGSVTTFPYWDLDPLLFSLPGTSLTPSGSMLLDVLVLLGAAMLLAGAGLSGRRTSPVLLALCGIGGIAALLHGWVLGPYHGSLGDQRIGSAWLAAVVGGVALWHAAADARVRAVAGGVTVAFILVLLCRGLQQEFIEHPQAVADFNADPGRIYAAHGWTPDSPMAKGFRRRLLQPEASGWFGLSNVYASFAAASLVAGIGLCAAAWSVQRNPDRTAGRVISPAVLSLLVLVAGGASIALLMARSKGGWIAACAGFAALCVLGLLSRAAGATPARSLLLRRIGGLVGLSAILGAVGLIVVRGVIGERIGELSLLFRWFYVETASRIFAAHPVFGVGPDNFQAAYALAKPGISPEEVSSPHSILFDWIATLGVFGLAWCILLMRGAYAAGAAACDPPQSSWTLSRAEVRAVLVIPAIATLAATFIEAPLITPDTAMVRVAGLLLWCAGGWAVARTMSATSARVAFSAGALGLLAHAQIDVSASWVTSVGLVAIWLALAAAPRPSAQPVRAPDRSRSWLIAPTLLAVAAGWIAVTVANYTRRWEAELNLAAAPLREIAGLNERLAPPRPGLDAANPRDAAAAFVELEARLGHPIDRSRPDWLALALQQVALKEVPGAIAHLQAAHAIIPADRRPLREASRLALQIGDVPGALRAFDLDLANPPIEATTTDLRWAALLNDAAGYPRTAAAAYEQAMRLEPSSLEVALRLMRVYQRLEDDPKARFWAQRVLDLAELQRLDAETRGISQADRDAAMALLRRIPPAP